ncbi:hypothetical protein DAVIS_05404 [Mycobacterium marinum]|uniref:Uncharacterized protein n=1 Tax=Mycobacterium marinum TaxID=1781 RepID=A0A3E2MN09_MYCMR|nr:hypothetical protein DAVIS_05404 [Mycobacterium marinum]
MTAAGWTAVSTPHQLPRSSCASNSVRVTLAYGSPPCLTAFLFVCSWQRPAI